MSNGEYSEMIELPVSTCEMVVVPKKKRLFKGRLIKKVNERSRDDLSTQVETTLSGAEKQADVGISVAKEGESSLPTANESERKRSKPAAVKKSVGGSVKKFRFDLVVAEAVAIFVLIVAILLTNIFWEDSGINTMIRSVFGAKTETSVDVRTAKDLAVYAPSKSADVTSDSGVMTFNEAAAVYAAAGGKVASVIVSDGRYTLTIAHSDVFKTIISGADAVYVKEGDSVYDNIPVAYAVNGTTVSMYDDGAIVKNFTLDNGKIVWQS